MHFCVVFLFDTQKTCIFTVGSWWAYSSGVLEGLLDCIFAWFSGSTRRKHALLQSARGGPIALGPSLALLIASSRGVLVRRAENMHFYSRFVVDL